MIDNGPEPQPPSSLCRWFLACKTEDLSTGAREVLIHIPIDTAVDVETAAATVGLPRDQERADAQPTMTVDTRVIAVFRNDDGVYALDGMCAHQGGPLAKGTLDGSCITCPWHGWQYDVASGRNLLTGRQMLTTYSVEQRGDEIWIALPITTSPTASPSNHEVSEP